MKISTFFYFQKRTVSAETIRGNTVFKVFTLWYVKIKKILRNYTFEQIVELKLTFESTKGGLISESFQLLRSNLKNGAKSVSWAL
jgi:hypothetical protein